MIYSFDGDWANDESNHKNLDKVIDTDPYWGTYGNSSYVT